MESSKKKKESKWKKCRRVTYWILMCPIVLIWSLFRDGCCQWCRGKHPCKEWIPDFAEDLEEGEETVVQGEEAVQDPVGESRVGDVEAGEVLDGEPSTSKDEDGSVPVVS